MTRMRIRPAKRGGFPVALAARTRPNRVMSDAQQLNAAVADLIGVTRQLAEQVQKIAIHLERETTRLPDPGELPLILSELSELHQRLRKLPATPA